MYVQPRAASALGGGVVAVAVAAGPALGDALVPHVNIVFGDLVEACYPYFDSDWVVSLAAYAGALLSGALLATARCHATAYVPLPLAAALSSDPLHPRSRWRSLYCSLRRRARAHHLTARWLPACLLV
jgi:hypothetical protein